MRWMRSAAAVTCLGLPLLGGCDSGDPPAAPPVKDAPQARAEAEPETGRIEARARPEPEAARAARPRLSDAMLSVYYHAAVDRDPELAKLPEALRPGDLDAAVDLIARDDSDFSRARRDRAIAKLVAADPSLAKFRRQLDRLGAPLEEIEVGLAAARLEPGVEINPVVIEWLVQIILNAVFPPLPMACTAAKVETDVVLLPNDVTRATVGVSVNRSIAELARVIDPQNWDECEASKEYFPQAHVALPQSDGTYIWDTIGDVAADPNAPAPSTKWNRQFFEEFAGSAVNWFKTLLTVSTVYSMTDDGVMEDFWMGYDLHTSVRSRVVLDEGAGGMDIDQGYGWLWDEGGGWTRYEGFKLVRLTARPLFTRPELNALNKLAVEVMADSSGEWLCCNAP